MKKTTGWRVILLKSILVPAYAMAAACAYSADTPTNTPTATATFTNTPVISSVWRVNAGGPQYADFWGNTWTADSNFSTGTARSITSTVSNTNDSLLYQTERYGSPFTYTFYVPPGNYQVTLKFAELYWQTVGSRVFDVFINGALALDNFDIRAEAGSVLKAVSKVFNDISPSLGQITLQFGPASKDYAQVCAIQINPMPPTPTPTRTPCPPTAIVPYIQVGAGIYQKSSSVVVNQGSAVNLGPQPFGGTWSWTGPSGYTANTREITNVPLTLGTNIYTATYTNSCGIQSSQAFTVTLMATAAGETVAGCASGMVIDGNMTESAWGTAAVNPVSKLAMGTNPNNVTGEFRTLWDTGNLYVGLAINDAYLNATQVACANYNDSAVELYLDMANDHGAQPYPGSVGDFHFMISYDSLQFCLNAAVALPPGGMQYASKYDASGYTMEVKIPWTLLGVVPVIDDTYQFDVQVDFNNGTSERVGQLVWNGDSNDWQSSANFGDIRIGFCPSPTPTATPVPPSLPESFFVFPNPVNPKQSKARINYHILSESEISIKIFTVNGSLVKTLLDKALKPAGRHNEDAWDAKNESGVDVLSGVYLCVLEVTDKPTGAKTKLTRKLAVLR